MSFANYLSQENGEKIASFAQVYLRDVPNDIDDGARIADSIRYVGNATYPEGTQTTISATDFQPLFQDGLSQEDFLRIKTDLNNANYPQLANIQYKIRVKGLSMDTFSVRFATYDQSLNLVKGYDPVVYDPSAFTHQTETPSFINLRGFSVDYDKDAVYGFMEISGDGTGSIVGEFDYANSELQNSLDTSRDVGELGARSTTNIFALDLDDLFIDASGAEAQILALEADVSTLQGDVSGLQTDVGDLQTDKVSKSGDVMSGGLTTGNGASRPSGWATSIRLGDNNTGGAYMIEGADLSGEYRPSIGIYSEASGNERSIYIWSGAKSENSDLSNWNEATLKLEDVADFGVGLNVQGDVSMNGNRVGGLGEAVDGSDAVNKGYVDTQDTLLQDAIDSNDTAISQRLPLSGGTMTGPISMGGSRIKTVGVPVQGGDVATKSYVDANAGDGDLEAVLTRSNDAKSLGIQNVGGMDGITLMNVDTMTVQDITANRLTNGIYYTGEINSSTGGGGAKFDIPENINTFHFLFRRQFPTDFNDSRMPTAPVGTILHAIGSVDSGAGFMRFFQNSDTGYNTVVATCGNNERIDFFRTTGGWIFWKFSVPGTSVSAGTFGL